MKERIQRAYDNHKRGYNCAQSVVCACPKVLALVWDGWTHVAQLQEC